MKDLLTIQTLLRRPIFTINKPWFGDSPTIRDYLSGESRIHLKRIQIHVTGIIQLNLC
jgi:hypothetical protein